MRITFDPNKNQLNQRKHGVDLVDVEAVFFDPARRAEPQERRAYEVGR